MSGERLGNCRAAGFVIASLAAATVSAQQAPVTQAPLPGAQPQEIGSTIDLTAAAYHTDNALRIAGNSVDDTIYSIGARIDVRHDGPYFDASIDGDLDWTDYAKTDYDARLLGFFDGRMSLSNGSGGLSWNAHESYGQLRRNPYGAETQANFEEVNYFSTGPSARFHLSSSTELLTYAEWSRATHDRSSLDSDQWRVGLSLLLGSRPDAGLSMHVVSERNEFGEEAPAGSNFDVYAAFMRYEAQTARTSFSMDAGYTTLRSDLADDSSPLVRIIATRQLGAATSIYLNATQEFSTAASAMRSDAANRSKFGAQSGQFSQLATEDAFQNRDVEAGFNYDLRRTRFTLAGTWNQQRYRTSTELDRDSTGGYAAIARQIRPTVGIRLEGSIRREKFLVGASDSQETELLFEVSKRLGRATEIGLSAGVFKRTDSENASSEFTEHRYGLNIRHRLLDRR